MSRPFPVNGVDLFCGVGGLTHGLRRAGINVTAGVDIDPACAYPYEVNNKAKFFEWDVAELDPDKLQSLFPRRGLKLLAGCAPCQPFSTYSRSGRGRQNESKWPLLLSFGRLVEALQPDLVTMENVPQILDHEVFQGFLQSLDGYSTWWSTVECSSLGVPQTRKRLVLLASKLGSADLRVGMPAQEGYRSVRDTIGLLPPIEAGGKIADDPLHTAPTLSPLNMKRIQASRPGGSWRDWPVDLQAACHRRSTGATYPSVYGRMNWDQPAPTITTQCFGYGNGRFGHPEQDRAISLREAAMLQTFPRDYAFIPPQSKVRFNRLGRLIGNAVPVRLGEVIGEALVRHVQAAA
ncbi:MAG TPA: DNA (cytosine-5-)-methyltransferase [Solirubrobacterales bacterium]|nr:DNA (cytosine-5-)-methyltransferase [Solirubrobacterales bacterium]